MRSRAKEINDFSHTTIQMAAFAHGDDMYINGNVHPIRLLVDYFNSPIEKNYLSHTITRYEISFKGDIDSGRWSESDFNSDIDAINIYERMINDGDISLDAWGEYYEDVDSDSKVRASEFFKNMGDGDEQIGIINTRDVIEEPSMGSSYIQIDASKDNDLEIEYILK